MPPEQSNPTPEELQWLNDFLAAHAAELAQTSGAKAVQSFAKAMGGATPEIQQAWLESKQSTAREAATKAADQVPVQAATEAVGQAGGDAPVTATAQPAEGSAEDFETIAERIYSRALAELSDDGMVPADAELDGIWLDARSAAGSWTLKTEDDLVTRVVDSYTMKIMDEASADELYEVITGFIDDIERLVASENRSHGNG